MRLGAWLVVALGVGCGSSEPPPSSERPKPVETKPAETKPAETKPAAAKPRPAQPAPRPERDAADEARIRELEARAAQERDADRTAEASRRTAPGTGRADLRHVRVGQRYHYAMQNKMAQVWTVKEVGPTKVTYFSQFYMNGQPLGDPQYCEWVWEPAESLGRVTRERVTVSGVTFDCLVSDANGAKAWIPTIGGVRTFPGIARSRMADGTDVMRLVRIDR